MKIMKSKLTVKQAIAEGFQYAGQQGKGFQRLEKIEELNPIDIKTGNWHLASKESISPTIDSPSLIDLISNDIDGRWYDETHDDDSQIFELLKDLNVDELVKEIKSRLSSIWNRTLTDIQLTNNHD